MEWGDKISANHTFTTWTNKWKQQIAISDPGYMRANATSGFYPNIDIWRYLEEKLLGVLGTKKKIGQAGWEFHEFYNVGRYQGQTLLCTMIWGDGGHVQELPLESGSGHCPEWWPCIVVDHGGDNLPGYCPGLAWANARPWYVHRSRARIYTNPVILGTPVPPPPAYPPPGYCDTGSSASSTMAPSTAESSTTESSSTSPWDIDTIYSGTSSTTESSTTDIDNDAEEQCEYELCEALIFLNMLD
jgi:hypothetical protein